MNGSSCLSVALAAVVALNGAVKPQSARPTTIPVLTRIGSVALPRVEGRMDHFAFDSKRNRLWVAGLENHSLEVIDLRTRRPVGSISGLLEPQGLIYVAEKDFVFVASRGDGTLRSFDAQTFKPGPWVDLGRNADNVRYDARTRTLYVGSGGEPDPGAVSAISLASMLPVERGGVADEPISKADLRLEQPRQSLWKAQVALPAHPESLQIDPLKGQIYVNVPDEHTVTVVKPTPQGLKISARWPVASKKNHPLVLDAANSRAFVVCRIPPVVFSYDTNTGCPTEKTPCVGDGDDAFYDAATHRLFVIGGEGFVDVFEALPRHPLRLLQRVKTFPRARTGAFMPSLHLFAVAVPHVGRRRAQLLFFRVR